MLRFVRRSLLFQLLSVYLLFVVVVLIGGLVVNAAVEQRLTHDAGVSDQALAQEIALATSFQLGNDENALNSLSQVLAQANTPQALTDELATFKAVRSDVDYVYWVDPIGIVQATWPVKPATQTKDVVVGSYFSPPGTLQRVLLHPDLPALEVGAAVEPVFNPGEPVFNPGVIVAKAVVVNGKVSGIVAASFSLVELSMPLEKVMREQQVQGRHLVLSTIDDQGRLIARSDHTRFLSTVLDELPGADQALRRQMVSRLGPGPDGQNWLFSSAPVPVVGWAVVVQRPASEALAVVGQFHLWLLAAALLFAIGGLLFWLLLVGRVIHPLQTLALQHQALPASEEAIPPDAIALAAREDAVGELATSLLRLERDGLEKLAELRTLLETSNVVVGSLDPRAVVRKIIHEVRRLVDVQAAAVLLPDEHGVLHVLVADGHGEGYLHTLSLAPENEDSSAVRALRDGKPVQKLLAPDQPSPSLSYDEGFRAVLAIPIISRHAGSVVLLVHRAKPQLFDQAEVDLLLTFANYATLAWEHAVLYERSDERLREIAHENKQLYQQASAEKQRLEAIMGSMNDGLVLTGIDGIVLYANLGACALANLPVEALERQSISVLYEALRDAAADPVECARTLARAESAETTELVIELRREKRQVIHLLLFAVNNETGRAIGRGLLLRDITRERELDEFKTTLLAAVGHELRTPLAAIKGHASTLLQQDVSWSPADERHFLQTISGEADRLARLVSNLLDLSRQEAGLLLLNCGPARIEELVARSIAQFGQSGERIVAHIPADLPLISVDSARLEVVLHNLLANALAYGERDVNITATRREREIVVAISDNGPGIAPSEVHHIFERFYRAHYGRQQRSGGTGLGLAICKAFIEAHGGAIWAESTSQGTTFAFSLPCVSSTVEAAPANLAAITLPLREE